MFVLTAKISKPKLIAAGVLILAIILLIVLLATGGGKSAGGPAGGSNDERVAYLATYGWSVNATPTETQKVKLLSTSENRVFARYNELQITQGFDLTDHSGKEVMRYVYEILNYPDATAPVYATVLVSDGYIIGGDITNSAPDGVIHGFRKPTAATTVPTESTEPTQSSEPSESVEPTEPTEAETP